MRNAGEHLELHKKITKLYESVKSQGGDSFLKDYLAEREYAMFMSGAYLTLEMLEKEQSAVLTQEEENDYFG